MHMFCVALAEMMSDAFSCDAAGADLGSCVSQHPHSH